jgi:hypothetical protein
MSANDNSSMHDDKRRDTAGRLDDRPQLALELRPRASRALVWEAIAFDSRSGSVPAKSAAGSEHDRCEMFTVADAGAAQSSRGNSAAPRNTSRPRFRTEFLQDGTIQWLTQLPESLQPLELARLFPRITNRVCDLWDDPLLCNRNLTSLLADICVANRHVFPNAVAAELCALYLAAWTIL